MGGKLSLPLHQVFKQELVGLNELVNNILTEDNVFRNTNYNFLSQNVCAKHTIVLEEELGRHLKVNLQSLGTGLYLVPTSDNVLTSQGRRISKRDICAKISNHYMRILYLLTLIKYVYDLEHYGDYSIAGIVFRNIKVKDDIMSITHCSMPQKDYSHSSKDNKIDFGTLEGMSFFVTYVMTKDEAKVFLEVLRSILSRKPRGEVRKTICNLLRQKKIDSSLLKQIEQAFKNKFGSDLQCSSIGNSSVKTSNIPSTTSQERLPNLFMRVGKDNPIFMKDYCYNVNDVIIRLDSAQNKLVMNAFKTMQQNYKTNIANIERLMDKFVIKQRSGYTLKDIGKHELDIIADEIKTTIKMFYIQSIIDFQNLLDIAKNNQNIEVNIEQ
jgi:hypothetical protein